MHPRIEQLFTANFERYDGVPPINVWLMRTVYILMVVFMGKDSWTHIIEHAGAWEPQDAMVWSVWAAFGAMALIGVFRTVRMVPILLLEIFYKVLWLAIVAYPLWTSGKLAGSPAEGMTQVFVWVALPIVAMPWLYVFKTYLIGRNGSERIRKVSRA